MMTMANLLDKAEVITANARFKKINSYEDWNTIFVCIANVCYSIF
jgi:hypothetical protein